MDKCKMCGERQTLVHVLNCCPIALNHWCYNERHDAVLTVIANLLREELGEDFDTIADIGPEQNYVLPPDLVNSDMRPDIVCVSRLQKQAVLLELTVCFEEAYVAAKERKTEKYLDLVAEIEEKGYNVELITLEVGSRGLLCLDGFKQLHSILYVNKKKWMQFLKSVASTAISGSFKIWTSRNHKPE